MLVKVLNRCTRDGCIYVELLCVEVSCCSLLLCNYNQVDSVTQPPVSCLDATECTGAAGSRCRGSLNIVYLLLFCVFPAHTYLFVKKIQINK